MGMGKLINTILVYINNHPFSLAYACWRKYVSRCKKYTDIEYMYGYWYHRDKKSNDPVYFIFRFELPGTGIGSAANTMIFCYDWAIKNGVVPIIDLEGKGIYNNGKVGEQNVWEYCFDQPIPIKEALKQKNVYISCLGSTLSDGQTCKRINSDKRDISIHFVNRPEYYKELKSIGDNYLKLTSRLNDDVKEYIDQNLRGFNVLGVALREEFSLFPNGIKDDNLQFYHNHPKILNVKESINIVKKYFEEWECHKIFLSTMYEDSVEEFKDVFGDKVIFFPRKRERLYEAKQFINDIWENHGSNKKTNSYFRTDEWYERTVTYMEEIYILANCENLIGAPSSVSALAAIINGGKYNNIYFFEDLNHIAKIN